jgi:type VI secretion system secreted protein Hcp
MSRRTLALAGILAVAVALLPPAYSAQTTALYLKANGADIQGDSTRADAGQADSIQVYYYEQTVTAAPDAATGAATGQPTYGPVLIRKWVDRSSPLLLKAMIQNQDLDAVFKFYRVDPATRTDQCFYTVEFHQARITSIKLFSPDPQDPASAAMQPTEEISFVFGGLTWTHLPTATTWTDTIGPEGQATGVPATGTAAAGTPATGAAATGTAATGISATGTAATGTAPTLHRIKKILTR